MIPTLYTYLYYLTLYLLDLSVLLFGSLHHLFPAADRYVHVSSIIKRYAFHFSGKMLSDIPSYILVPFPVRLSLVWESMCVSVESRCSLLFSWLLYKTAI